MMLYTVIVALRRGLDQAGGQEVGRCRSNGERFRRLVTTVLPFDPHPYLEFGMEVPVVRGPLQGARHADRWEIV